MKSIFENWKSAISLLDKKSKVQYFALSACQVLLSILDIIAVALVGFVTVLLLNFTGSVNPFFESLQSGFDLTKYQAATVLLLIAVVLFSLRTWLAVKLIKAALLFLGKRSAMHSTKIFSDLLDRPSVTLSSRSLASKQYALVTGANSKILGILGGFSGLISDLSVTIGLFVFFLFASPAVAVSSAAIGLAFLAVLLKQTAGRGAELSRTIAETEIQARTIISNSISRYRESFVSGTLVHYKTQFSEARKVGVEATAHWTFLPNVGKYVLEAGVIIGGLLLGIILFSFESPEAAISILSMFLAASTRLAPALIRIQQGIVSIKGHGSQKEELDFLATEINSAKQVMNDEQSVASPSKRKESIGISISVNDLHYRHDPNTPLVEGWSLSVSPGSFVALIGKSGSGKSSLADLVLGLAEPSKGSVYLDGEDPAFFIINNRGSVGYVPQYSVLAEGTIRSNLSLGYDLETFSSAELTEALRACSIEEIAINHPKGLDAPISEQGLNLSGGQRQRLSLAHAILGRPNLLILDESTASLDKKSEIAVLDGVRKYLPGTTILAITHSANLTDEADQVLEISQGKISVVKESKN